MLYINTYAFSDAVCMAYQQIRDRRYEAESLAEDFTWYIHHQCKQAEVIVVKSEVHSIRQLYAPLSGVPDVG